MYWKGGVVKVDFPPGFDSLLNRKKARWEKFN
jgi:hypothetical protein